YSRSASSPRPCTIASSSAAIRRGPSDGDFRTWALAISLALGFEDFDALADRVLFGIGHILLVALRVDVQQVQRGAWDMDEIDHSRPTPLATTGQGDPGLTRAARP